MVVASEGRLYDDEDPSRWFNGSYWNDPLGSAVRRSGLIRMDIGLMGDALGALNSYWRVVA